MKTYVCGFAFFGPLVVLIKKNRPEWQAGQLNGIGGKIEPGESPCQAMAREFKEETGLIAPAQMWRPVCKYTTHRGLVYFFTMDLHQADCTLDPACERHTDERCSPNCAGRKSDSAWIRNMKTKCEEGTLHIFSINHDDPFFPPLEFSECRPNLNWLIPMALNITKEEAEFFTIEENYPLSSPHHKFRPIPEPRAVDALANLEKATTTFRERRAAYGDSYHHFGRIAHVLFPKGVTINSIGQWKRFGILVHILTKLVRYTQKPLEGHLDSIHDIGLYSFILEELDSLPKEDQ